MLNRSQYVSESGYRQVLARLGLRDHVAGLAAQLEARLVAAFVGDHVELDVVVVAAVHDQAGLLAALDQRDVHLGIAIRRGIIGSALIDDIPPENRLQPGLKYFDVVKPEYGDMKPIFDLAKDIMAATDKGK